MQGLSTSVCMRGHMQLLFLFIFLVMHCGLDGARTGLYFCGCPSLLDAFPLSLCTYFFLALPAYITDHITRFDFGGILFFGCWLLLGHEVVSMLAMDVTCLTTVAYLLLRNIACEGGSIKARDSFFTFHCRITYNIVRIQRLTYLLNHYTGICLPLLGTNR